MGSKPELLEQQQASEDITNILAKQRNKNIPESIMEKIDGR